MKFSKTMCERLVLLVALMALCGNIANCQVEDKFGVRQKCAATFQVLERYSNNGPRHGFAQVYDVKDRTASGARVPNYDIHFNNNIYQGCGADKTSPAIVPERQVGIHNGHCIETITSGANIAYVECYFTWLFKKGTIAAHGPIDFVEGTGILAITGGAGEYFGAKGEIIVATGNANSCNVGEDNAPYINTYTFCVA